MQRMFLGAVAALLLCVGPSFAAKDVTAALFKKADADKGVITASVGKKNDKTDKDFTITETTKFIFGDGDDKKEMTGKDGLKELKEGMMLTLTSEDGKLISVQVAKKKK